MGHQTLLAQVDPTNLDALCNLGQLLHNVLGRDDEAEEVYAKALNQSPSNSLVVCLHTYTCSCGMLTHVYMLLWYAYTRIHALVVCLHTYTCIAHPYGGGQHSCPVLHLRTRAGTSGHALLCHHPSSIIHMRKAD
jgi:hypothetical protein